MDRHAHLGQLFDIAGMLGTLVQHIAGQLDHIRLETTRQNHRRIIHQTDNTNADFYILKGDVYAAQNMYSDAITAYNQAVTYGGNSTKVWQAKVEAEVKMMQKKYNTGSNTSDLAAKISAADKQMLCTDISQAKNYGVHVQNIDLLQLAICK